MKKSENKFLSIGIGIALVILGIYLLSTPILTLLSIATLLAFTILIRGIFTGVVFFKNKSSNNTNWILLLNSIIFVILGLILLFNPKISSTLVLYLVSAWFIVDGITGLSVGLKLNNKFKWFSIIISILLIIYGLSLAIDPIRALFALNILVGLSVITDGVQSILNAFLE
ncbi:DUF308 domain-containing protein [Helcococcus bovis]|uniref:HdeD family acid-resistance protein n=1 Tax=Helcococcus bovis TaxID=3153252 RepID=UPI0038BD8CE0